MLKDLTTALRPAVVLTLLFAVLLGIVYPLALTGIGQTVLPRQANGSLIREKGKVIGSELIGQNFTAPGYFHGRLSAAGNGYDATASSGSNLGPTSKVLHDRMQGDLAKLHSETPGASVPADLVTTSASGLDPDISPEAALFQVERVARARGIAPERVKALIAAHTDEPVAGYIGEPHVNVLALNRALDAEARRP